MQFIKFLVLLLALTFAGSGAALADYRYDIIAVDDVDGDPTFSGTMTTSAPFSLEYNFSVLGFVLNNPLDNVTYRDTDASITIDRQGFTFVANNNASSFILTLYPDNSYFSEFTAFGQTTVNNSGYFSFVQQTTAVPEPQSSAMLLIGFALLGWVASRKKNI
ncbi:MAG: PEP-CTERM sorting domain-containing protein [Methylophilus sp.]|uniref:PEP-CTERM sorting domain-containing protein n=1 Tax=Methylophilus sp. TaxID=29541 RepID=UPI003F9F6F07